MTRCEYVRTVLHSAAFTGKLKDTQLLQEYRSHGRDCVWTKQCVSAAKYCISVGCDVCPLSITGVLYRSLNTFCSFEKSAEFVDSVSTRHGAYYAAIGLSSLVIERSSECRAAQPSIAESGYCTVPTIGCADLKAAPAALFWDPLVLGTDPVRNTGTLDLVDSNEVATA